MGFTLEYGLDKNAHDYMVRIACRAIVSKGGKLLMLSSNHGDCLFPGGGVDDGETHREAVIREISEETGYLCNHVGDHVCTSHERKIDKFQPDKYIDLINHFYVCKIDGRNYGQQLEAYEVDLELEAKWVTVDQAIEINEAFRRRDMVKDFWRLRTIEILKRIKNGKIVLLES